MDAKKTGLLIFAILISVCIPLHALANAPSGCFIWMEYGDSPTTGMKIWQKGRKSDYCAANAVESFVELSGDEDGYLLTNPDDETSRYMAIRDVAVDPNTYTVLSLKEDGSRPPLFTFSAKNVFSFLGFQETGVYFARRFQLSDGIPYRYSIIRSDSGQETVLVSFENAHWKRPSINAKGEILYTSLSDGVQKVFYLDADLNSAEIIEGSDAVWYDDETFFYIRDNCLRRFDLTTSEDELYLTEKGQPVSVGLNPYVGDGIYLSADRSALVYAAEVEEMWLFMIHSGYYSKRWNVLNLSTGSVSVIGNMEESHDNAVAY